MDLCAGVDYSPQIIPLWGHAACRLNRPALSPTSTGMLVLCFPSQESVGLRFVGQIKDETDRVLSIQNSHMLFYFFRLSDMFPWNFTSTDGNYGFLLVYINYWFKWCQFILTLMCCYKTVFVFQVLFSSQCPFVWCSGQSASFFVRDLGPAGLCIWKSAWQLLRLWTAATDWRWGIYFIWLCFFLLLLFLLKLFPLTIFKFQEQILQF